MSVNWFDKSISLLCEYFFSLARFACACVSRSNSKDALTWVSLLSFFFFSLTPIFLLRLPTKRQLTKYSKKKNVFAKNSRAAAWRNVSCPWSNPCHVKMSENDEYCLSFLYYFSPAFQTQKIYIWQTHAVSRIFFLCDENRLPKKLLLCFSLFDLLHPSQYFVVSILDCLIEMYVVNSINRSYVALKVVV